MGRSALLSLMLALLCACTSGTVVGPAGPVPLTPKMLAVVVEDHLGAGFAAYAPPTHTAGEVATSVYYAAEPGHEAWTVTASLGPGGQLQEATCAATSPEAPKPHCLEHHGVRLAWSEGMSTLLLSSARTTGFAVVAVEVQAELTAKTDPLTLELPVALDALVALAEDARIAMTTDAGLSRPAGTYPRWSDDPDCEQSRNAPRPVAASLPSVGTPQEAITPQAIAAVARVHLDGYCAGAAASESEAAVGATIYLTSSTERISVVLTPDPVAVSCVGWDSCTDRGGIRTAYLFDVPEEYPARLRLSRAVPGGYLVVTERSHLANPTSRAFPVPTGQLRAVLDDPHLTFEVDPALNLAADQGTNPWRLTAVTDE